VRVKDEKCRKVYLAIKFAQDIIALPQDIF